MAKKIYLGRMLEAVQNDMNSMSGDMVQMVAELIEVKEATVQGVSELNVVASDNLVFTLSNLEKSYTLTTAATDYYFAYLVPRCNGTIRMEIIINVNTNTGAIYFYTINGVKSGTNAVIMVNGDNTLTFDIPVNAGDVIGIGVTAESNNKVMKSVANSLKISYDLLDIINDGAVIYKAV